MLKKVSVDQLRVGMYLHGLCGPWADHPFWKSKFELRKASDLALLRDSSVRECWIDLAMGADVMPESAPSAEIPTPAAAPAAALAAAETMAVETTARPEPAIAVTISDELGRAAALVKASRAQVQSLFQEARMGRAIDAEQCLPLVNDIAASVWRNPGALISLARLKTHDDYSYMHSVAVCALMVSLARQLGQSEAQAREAGMAGLLHDMGKAVMPLAVLNKPGKLTPEEFQLIKSHPQRGHELLSSGSATPAVALDVCLHHHERPDGEGYPFGLRGDALSRAARMGAVCDVYDAITSNRPYKAGWDPADSISRMSAWSAAGQFDPKVFAAFVKSLGVYPVGSLVRLRSGRLAVVVEQSAGHLLKPRVRVFFSTKSRMPVARESIDTSEPGCTDPIVARESNALWKFEHLEEVWAGKDVLAAAAR